MFTPKLPEDRSVKQGGARPRKANGDRRFGSLQ
jgi:hypothetical protein